MTEEISAKNGIGKGCPLINRNIEGCYTTRLSDTDIEPAIRYCLNDYQKCDIYQCKDNHERD